MSDYTTMISLAAAITTVGGAYLTVQKIAKDAKRAKEEDAAAILHAAKEEDADLKLKMDAKLHAIEIKVKNLEENVEKDLSHLKETYSNEIKSLGYKIEALRDELKSQHIGVLNLLSKLIDKT